MLKTIEHSVRFPAKAADLYRIYMSPKLHAQVTGGKVTISPKPNSKFTAFDGMLTGTTLSVIPDQLIVQRWRSMMFKKADIDSLLVIRFVQDGKQGRIDLVHVNVPAHDHKGVLEGWTKYYWNPLRKYLKSAGK